MKTFSEILEKQLSWVRVVGQDKQNERIYSYKEVSNMLKKLEKAHVREIKAIKESNITN